MTAAELLATVGAPDFIDLQVPERWDYFLGVGADLSVLSITWSGKSMTKWNQGRLADADVMSRVYSMLYSH